MSPIHPQHINGATFYKFNFKERIMFSKLSKIIGILLSALVITTSVYAASLSSSWLSGGHDLSNTRYQADTAIQAKNVANLNVKWAFTTGGDVSATPSVDDTNIYFPDWAGNLFAVDKATGAQVWKIKVSDITGLTGDPSHGIGPDIARDTPAIDGNQIIFGDQAGYHGGQLGYVIAVDKKTGALNWKTAVGSVFTIVTQSPVVYNNTVYIGVASAEEAFEGLIPNYPCCNFHGAMYALDSKTGAIKWHTSMAPAGYSGNSVWGSTPVIDVKRNSVYITTGNNYSAPTDVQNCFAAAGTDQNAIQACVATLSPDNHTDAIVALDLNSGAVKWSHTGIPFDAFNIDCFPQLLPPGWVVNPQNCPPPAGPDYDFGQGAMFYTINGQDFVAAGQKSGQFWALNPDTGAVIWETQAAPGGVGGGMEWGSSTDGTNIYFASANTNHKPWVVNGNTITSGFWGALNAATGAVVWETPDPISTATDSGAVSSVNGVVFACSQDPQGHMYAMDSSNGHILWSFASGGSCNAGPSIVGGTVYWGSGYSNFGVGTPNNKLFAFGLK
jgi:polyvinyl alcohol dehydrogenase (cytochrome)